MDASILLDFDTSIANAYRIYLVQEGTLSHKEFRIRFSWQLLSLGAHNISNLNSRSDNDTTTTTSKNYFKKTVCHQQAIIAVSHSPYPWHSLAYSHSEQTLLFLYVVTGPLFPRTLPTTEKHRQTEPVRHAESPSVCLQPALASATFTLSQITNPPMSRTTI